MAHRINVVLDDAVWERFQEIPKGERSRLINEAVSESLLRRQQLAAWASLRERAKAKQPQPGSTEEWVREDRARHL